MNSPTSSHDDSLPESEAAPEQAPSGQVPSEPLSVLPADEPDVSAPTFALSDTPPKPDPVPARRVGGRGATGWALLLALVSLGVAGYTLWQAHEWRAQSKSMREEVAKRLQESDQAVGESRASAKREHESLNNILSKIGALEGQINESRGYAIALEEFYRQFSRSQDDRIAAEVRQAVEFARQQLQYAGNIEMALVVLREAQIRLERNDLGQFTDLRQALKADIEKLNHQDTLDMPRTASRLEHVLEKIDTLPLAHAHYGEILADESSAKPVEKKEEGFTHFVRGLAVDVWTELRSLVKIQRLATGAEPILLAPEQSAFLRENVKIRLLTARLAMLARDGNTYATDLKQACGWIESYFDMTNEDVKAAVDELRELGTKPVGVIGLELIESTAAVGRLQTRSGVLLPVLPPQPPDGGSGQAGGDVPETPAPPTQP